MYAFLRDCNVQTYIVGYSELRIFVWFTGLLKALGKFSLVNSVSAERYYEFAKHFDCVLSAVNVNEGLVMRVYWKSGLV